MHLITACPGAHLGFITGIHGQGDLAFANVKVVLKQGDSVIKEIMVVVLLSMLSSQERKEVKKGIHLDLFDLFGNKRANSVKRAQIHRFKPLHSVAA